MSKRMLVAIPLLFLSACAEKAGETPDTTAAAAAPATRAVVDAAREAWMAAAARDDAAAVGAMYTDDAVFVSSEAPPAIGRAAIQEALAQVFPISAIDHITSREVAVSGDIAYDYGEYQQTITPPGGAPQAVRGHYVVILRRQSDGSWKLAKHLDVSPPASSAQPQP